MELVLQHITKSYHKHVAVDDVNVVMNEGVYGLLGANGAGKTTLMKMMTALLKPTKGQILYDGEDIFQLKEHYRDLLGYLPQKFGFYPDFHAIDFLMYIATLKGIPRNEAKLRVHEVLELVNLMEVRKQKLHSYSGGMIQRLGIAQAMLNDPKILILDEPTAGLDPKERIRFRNIISNLSRNRIVVLSTHIVSDVEYIANELLLMKQGKLIAQGSVQELVGSMQGSVYEVKTTAEQAVLLQQNYTIANIRNEHDCVVLRMIAQDHVPEGARLVAPCLEDVYLSECKEVRLDAVQ